MNKIKINDIEVLNQKKEHILELEKRIKELQEVKEKEKLQQEIIELENKIEKYSIYDSIQISNIIAKLMTAFEEIEYVCYKNFPLMDCNYYIEPITTKIDDIGIYSTYKIKNLKKDRYFYGEKEMCYLPPTRFKSMNDSQNKNIEYIQLFIDYLYEQRSSKALEKITERHLETILQEFLRSTADVQQQRKIEIANQIEINIKKQNRRDFEKSCLIDRNLIYNSLSYIANHYESNMIAKTQTDEKWFEGRDWWDGYGYHNLIIEYNNEQIIYRTVINSIGCYPDEKYCTHLYVDTNKQTNINFFDIKFKLLPIINNSLYIKNFMDMIENFYNHSKNITSDNIQEFLCLISNEHKEKQKTLKIKNK